MDLCEAFVLPVRNLLRLGAAAGCQSHRYAPLPAAVLARVIAVGTPRDVHYAGRPPMIPLRHFSLALAFSLLFAIVLGLSALPGRRLRHQHRLCRIFRQHLTSPLILCPTSSCSPSAPGPPLGNSRDPGAWRSGRMARSTWPTTMATASNASARLASSWACGAMRAMTTASSTTPKM